MSTPCDRFADRLAAVAQAGPDPATAAHLRTCADCRRGVEEWRAIAAAVRFAGEQLPSPDERVLTGVWSRLGIGPTLDPATPEVTVPASPRRRWWRDATGAVATAASLVRGQVRLVGQRLWAASAVVMAVGAVLAVTARTPDAAGTLLAVLAPVLAAVGLSLVYGHEVDPGLEVALATPTSPRSVLLARMTVVFGYHLGLALLVNTVLVAAYPDLAWWWLVSQWLGPMLLLASLALLISVAVGPQIAIATALALWTLRLTTFTGVGRELAGGSVRAAVDGLWDTTALPVFLAAGLLAGALLLVGQRRWA